MFLSESADLDGIPLQFFDTAGVRETLDQVERIGVTRTLETLYRGRPRAGGCGRFTAPSSDEDLRLRETSGNLPHLVVANKSDLGVTRDPSLEELHPIWISARTAKDWMLCRSDREVSWQQPGRRIRGVGVDELRVKTKRWCERVCPSKQESWP